MYGDFAVSPTFSAASPTSMTTQGAPQAMASPTVLGNSSLIDDEQAISRDAYLKFFHAAAYALPKYDDKAFFCWG